MKLFIRISFLCPDTDSEATINGIKQWITEGSASLHSASQGWAQFNKVSILIPSTCDPVPEAVDANNVHEDAEIRVEPLTVMFGDSPYTLQTGECGEEGEYIQVNMTHFIRNSRYMF